MSGRDDQRGQSFSQPLLLCICMYIYIWDYKASSKFLKRGNTGDYIGKYYRGYWEGCIHTCIYSDPDFLLPLKDVRAHVHGTAGRCRS